MIKFRYIVPSRVPKELSKISGQSPYANIFGKLPGNYSAYFLGKDQEIELSFSIQKYHYSIISNMEDIELENDQISIESKGQILEIHFEVSGIFHLQKISMFIKNYDLFSDKRGGTGTFSGIDINNNPVSGEMRLELIKN